MASSSVRLPHPLGDQRIDLEPPLLPTDRVDVVGVVGQVGPTDGPVDPDDDVGGGTRDGQPLVVGRPVGIAGGAGRESVARPGRADAELVEGEGGGLDEAGQRLDEVDVDQLTGPPAHVPMVEGHHHRPGGGLGGHPVGQHERRQGGWAVGLPGHLGEAAHGLGQGAEPRSVARRAAPAVAADVEHHQLWVAGVDRLVVEAPAVQRARPVAHDHHVADRQQLVEEVLALGLAEVEGDAALVPADALPHQADAVLAVPPGAQAGRPRRAARP